MSKFCQYCGRELNDTDAFCKGCGNQVGEIMSTVKPNVKEAIPTPIPVTQNVPPVQPMGQQVQQPMQQPMYNQVPDPMGQPMYNQVPNPMGQPMYNNQGYNQMPQPMGGAPINPNYVNTKTNGWCIAGFIFSFLSPLLSVIFCIVGKNKIKQYGGKGEGLATAGIIIALVNWVLGMIIAFQ